MAKKIENTPSPSVLMNSMRSIGYSFKTALADIIDNSICAGAKNVYISSPINDFDLFISILDDGNGMTKIDLFNAMKYGSDREYSSNDLGRFGLGLKSASLSQCRVLTVASKIDDDISVYRWDIDSVLENKKWACLELEGNEIDSLPNIESLKELKMGTLVLWQNFDIAYKKNNGKVREYLADEIEEAEKHIRLVFHRFLSSQFKNLKIYINNNLLEPIDPFLEDHTKTDSRKVSEIAIEGNIIKVQPYVLPYQSDLSVKDINKLGGIETLRQGQGFYIYRNNRLIIYGTWFRLSSSTVSPELLKYGRIKVDIPNSLDEIWDIDIKKQNATIPKQILTNLKKAVRDVCSRSKDKTSKRTKLTLEKDDSKIWNKYLSKNGKETYSVNKESSFITKFLDDFDDKDRNKILNLIDVISTNIPFDDIYNSICNKQNEVQISDSQMDAIVQEGIIQFKMAKRAIHRSNKEVMDLISRYEPFNNDEVAKRIWEVVENEK